MTYHKEPCVGGLPLINNKKNLFTTFFNMQFKKERIKNFESKTMFPNDYLDNEINILLN